MFCVPVWICPFHISVPGYGTIYDVKKNITHIKSDAGIYVIQCLDWNEKEMCVKCSIKFKKNIYKHKRDLKRGNINNAMIQDNLETNHNF